MKRILCILLFLVLLSSCSFHTNPADENSSTESAPTAHSPGTVSAENKSAMDLYISNLAEQDSKLVSGIYSGDAGAIGDAYHEILCEVLSDPDSFSLDVKEITDDASTMYLKFGKTASVDGYLYRLVECGALFEGVTTRVFLQSMQPNKEVKVDVLFEMMADCVYGPDILFSEIIEIAENEHYIVIANNFDDLPGIAATLEIFTWKLTQSGGLEECDLWGDAKSSFVPPLQIYHWQDDTNFTISKSVNSIAFSVVDARGTALDGRVLSFDGGKPVISLDERIYINNAFYSEYKPIVYNSILLGGYHDGAWVDAQKLSLSIVGGEKYSLYTSDSLKGYGLGGKSYIHPTEPDAETIFVYPLDGTFFDWSLSLGGDWDAMPRKSISQSNNSETYVQIIADILAESGLHDVPVQINQNYRIDLDGDGQDEVLICAQNFDYGELQKASTYSLLVMRKIIDGTVESIFVNKDIYLEDDQAGISWAVSIKGIFDLNGDGIMEIITRESFYEGFLYCVYAWDGEAFEKVLVNGVVVG